LLITVKPQVITNNREMRKVTEELRRRLSRVSEYERMVKASRSAE
jgi:hypothetical protein